MEQQRTRSLLFRQQLTIHFHMNLSYNLLVIKSDAVVLQEFNLKLIVVLIVSMFVPYVF